MNIKGVSGEDSDGNEERLLETGGDLSYSGKEYAELSSIILWKVEYVSCEVGYLAKEVSKLNVEDAGRFSLLLIVKCEKREMN